MKTISSAKELRKKTLSTRSNLGQGEWAIKSEQIKEKILTLKQVQQSKILFCYVDYKKEVGTCSLIEALLEQNKKVAVPLTLVEERRLVPVSVSSLEKDLEAGYCGIPEPKAEVTAVRTIDPKTIDVVVLPGSVFDERGGRMGYGGGFYDRFLANKSPEAIRIGICFDLQLQKQIELEPHDEMMDYIVTETRLIKTNRL